MKDFDERTDLRIERLIAAKPETVWRCWTDPELFAQWFAPKPVEVRDVDYEFQPGGKANLTMILPDGTSMALQGCVLLVEPARRLITTDAMLAGFRPGKDPFLTSITEFQPQDDGTFYRATALHNDEAQRLRHEEMGFYDGRGTVIRQLAEMAQSLEGDAA